MTPPRFVQAPEAKHLEKILPDLLTYFGIPLDAESAHNLLRIQPLRLPIFSRLGQLATIFRDARNLEQHAGKNSVEGLRTKEEATRSVCVVFILEWDESLTIRPVRP